MTERAWTWRGKSLAEISSEKLLWALDNDDTWPPFREACRDELDVRVRAWKGKYPRRRWRATEQRRGGGHGR